MIENQSAALPPEFGKPIFEIKPECHYYGLMTMKLPGGDVLGVRGPAIIDRDSDHA